MPKRKTRRRSGQNGHIAPPVSAGPTPPAAGVPTSPAEAPLTASRPAEFVGGLKAARERRGVTIEQIAQSTKVSAWLLAALERGDLSRWPKGIFRKSFFRDYVTAIGLPPESHMALFVDFFPDEEDRRAAAPQRVRRMAAGGVMEQAIGWVRRRIRSAVHGIPVTSLSAGNP